MAKKKTETLYDQPYEDKGIVRLTGPFTVESLSPHRMLPHEPEALATGSAQPVADASGSSRNYLQTMLDNLRKAGVKGTDKSQRIGWERLDPFPGEYIQAEGTTDSGAAVRVSIGPEFGTVGDQWIKAAALEAIKGSRCDLLLVCAFAFEASVHEQTAELTKEIQLGKLRVLPVRMNPDLAMGDELLKKTGAGNLFTVFGEPDVKIEYQPEGRRGGRSHGSRRGRVRPDNRRGAQRRHRRHRLLVHRHRLRRAELLRASRLLLRGKDRALTRS